MLELVKRKEINSPFTYNFSHFKLCFKFPNFDDVFRRIQNYQLCFIKCCYECRMKQMRLADIDLKKDDNVMTHKNLFWYVITFNLFLFLLRFS